MHLRILMIAAICMLYVSEGFCAEPIKSLRLDGRLIVVNDKATILVGDSVTQGWMELGSSFNQKQYIDALAERGINAVMIWSYIGIVDPSSDERIGYDAKAISPWKKTESGFDLNKFNNSYFQRLGQLVRYACNKGIVVIITIHDGWTKTRFKGHPFNKQLGGPLESKEQYVDFYDYNVEMPKTYNPSWNYKQKNQYFQERFTEKIVEAAAGNPNVIFEIFNEGEWYNKKKLDMYQDHFLKFIKKRTKALTMINDRPALKNLPYCDIYSLHSPGWSKNTNAEDSFNCYLKMYEQQPSKPLIFSEPVPEYRGDESMNKGLMRLMWGTALTGSGFLVQNDCSFGFDSHSKMASKRESRNKIFNMESICVKFINALNIEKMRPSSELSNTGVCLAYPGHEYAVYMQERESSVDLTDVKGDTQYRFYDPQTGAYTRWKRCESGKSVGFDSFSDDDRVLYIKKIGS